MGLVSKGVKCNVSGCDEDSVRSLNTQKVEAAGLNVESTGKKSLLCKTHYKEWKKETKDDRELTSAHDTTSFSLFLNNSHLEYHNIYQTF